MNDDGPASLGWFGGGEIWYALLDLRFVCVCCSCLYSVSVLPTQHGQSQAESDRISPGPAQPVQHSLTRTSGSLRSLAGVLLRYSHLGVVFYSELN